MRQDLTVNTPSNALLLIGAAPTPQSSISNFTFVWKQVVVTSDGILMGDIYAQSALALVEGDGTDGMQPEE